MDAHDTDIDWQAIDHNILQPAWYAAGEHTSTFAVMREVDPVHRASDAVSGMEYWFLTRYDDVKRVLADNRSFSNRRGNRMPRSPQRVRPEQRYEMGIDLRISWMDSPMHDVYRRPMNKHFSVPVVSRLASDIDGYMDEILDEISDKEEFDIIDDVTAILPLNVFLRMLGVPRDDWMYLQRCVNEFGHAADPRYTIDGDPVKTSNIGLQKLVEYSHEMAVDRHSNPRDDFATVVAGMKIDGDTLSIKETASWYIQLFLGGLETTRNALGIGLWQLLENPDQAQLLRDQPDLLDGAIDEVLRFASSAREIVRVANDDMEFGGRNFRAGDWVISSLYAANRDPAVFPDPDRFDIRRAPVQHLTLGEGLHKCLGRNLLRLELAIAIPRFLHAFPSLELREPPEWVADVSNAGLAHAWVRNSLVPA